MKILIPLLLFCTIAHSQDSLYSHFPLEEDKVVYTRIVEIDSASKDVLFSRIKDWAVDSYKSQKAALQSEDKETGYLAFKGYLPTTLKYRSGLFKGSPYEVDIYHTLKFYIKDNKVKIVFMDLESLSKDAGSAYLESRGTYTTPKVPVEDWAAQGAKLSAKKKEKYMNELTLDARSVNRQIITFLTSIEQKLRSKKNAFDF